VESERQEPVAPDVDAPKPGVQYPPQPDDQDPRPGAGGGAGLFQQQAIDQDRDRQAMENAEENRRGPVEDVGGRGDEQGDGRELQPAPDVAPAQGAADPGQDDEQPGEEELGEVDKQYLRFGRGFEEEYITQSLTENRTIEQTLNIGWKLLGLLPKEELTRLSMKEIEQYYKESNG